MFSQTVRGFLAAPFDPDGDGQTSLLEWFAFVGLMLVFIRVWTYLLNELLEA